MSSLSAIYSFYDSPFLAIKSLGGKHSALRQRTVPCRIPGKTGSMLCHASINTQTQNRTVTARMVSHNMNSAVTAGKANNWAWPQYSPAIRVATLMRSRLPNSSTACRPWYFILWLFRQNTSTSRPVTQPRL